MLYKNDKNDKKNKKNKKNKHYKKYKRVITGQKKSLLFKKNKKKTDSSAKGKTRKKGHEKMIEFLTLGCTQIELPLPKRLTKNEVLIDAGEVNESSFFTEAAKEQFRALFKQGYRLVSWSDGTRAAYKKQNGKNLTAIEGVRIYKECRNKIEMEVTKLQFCSAGCA